MPGLRVNHQKAALVACIRRLLIILNLMVKRHSPWQDLSPKVAGHSFWLLRQLLLPEESSRSGGAPSERELSLVAGQSGKRRPGQGLGALANMVGFWTSQAELTPSAKTPLYACRPGRH